MALDLALDTDRDLSLEDYDLALIAGVDLVVQRLWVGMHMFKGEWYLNEDAGLPYYRDVLTSSPRLTIVEAVFRAAILAAPEIEAISVFEMGYDGSARTLSVDFKAASSEGEVEVSEVFP